MNLQDLIGQQQQSPTMPPVMPQTAPYVPDDNEELSDDFFDVADYDDQGETPQYIAFHDNLALHMEEQDLKNIAMELLDYVADDEEIRRDWMDKITEFKEQIGLNSDASYEQPFPGSSVVTYPIFVEAQLQFQARALPQIYPNDPAKAVVLGVTNPALDQQSARVEDFLNYQIQYQDKGNKKDFKKMLWWLPLTGSTFRHVYHNPLKKKNMARFVPVEKFIVPYATVSLEDSPRYAHIFDEQRNDLLKLQKIGFYREFDIPDQATGDDEESNNTAQEVRDAADGQKRTDSTMSNTNLQECVHVYIDYDLKGFEDQDAEGEPTGIALSYKITIHKDTQEICGIWRNWEEDDELKEKLIDYTHYKFQEGPGFYGSGLPHLIGSLQTATTGALRAFGDALAFAMLQGGWKTKDAKVAGDEVMTPGKFLDVDMTTDDLNKAIKMANFQPPPNAVIDYIEMLDKKAETIVSIPDLMTGGTTPQNSPVGTTVAMIEQASKIITAQHGSLFESFSEELQILFRLNYYYLPENANFMLPGKVMNVSRSDFDCKQVAVQPTADPQVSSFQQRQAIDQATMQICSVSEFKVFVREGGYPLMKRVLTNMGVPSLDEIILTDQEAAALIQQQQQQPPQPTPDQIKAQVMQAKQQTDGKTAETNANLDEARLQEEQKQNSINNQLAAEKLKLDKEQMIINAVLEDKNIDATVFKTVTPSLMAATDGFATDEAGKLIQTEQLETAQQHKNAVMGAAQAHAQAYAQQSQAPQQMAQAAAVQQQNPQPQLPPSAPVNPLPAKPNILAAIMNKIKGR